MTNDTPSTFSHPDWVCAISAQIPGATHVTVPPQGFRRLFVALSKKRLPVAYFESWQTPLTPSGLPAVAPGAADAVNDMLANIECPILFRNLPDNHPVTAALLAHATHHHTLHHWQRSGLHLDGTFDNWFTSNFDPKRRKEFKRLRNRLSEQGTFLVRKLAPDGEIDGFIKGFLALEQSGWKGKRGTAVAKIKNLPEALAAGLKAMHAHGRLRFWEFSVDGKVLASLFALVDGGEATLGKIAHDEAWGKFSPGVLIILEATQDLFAEEGLCLADSNAMPGHPMIDRIWRDRIPARDVLVAGPQVPTALFNALRCYLGTKHAARSLAKRLLARFTGRRQS